MKVRKQDPNFDACLGGRPEWVWDFARSQMGVVFESSHIPYNQNPFGTCLLNLKKGDEEAMKCHLANNGPLHVSITMYKTSLASYKSGIWDDPTNDCSASRIIDHAVYLVGYGTEKGQTGQMIDYWLAQNSWGKDYGEKGFFKIKRGVNLCLIASDAMYPVLKTSLPQPLQPVPTFTGCILSGDVFNSRGVYIKSYCADNFGRNYRKSRIECLKKGGQLYQLDSAEAQRTLFNAADATWTRRGFIVELFVNGTRANGCNGIFNFNPFGPVSNHFETDKWLLKR
jgi:hypothetical protein